MNEPPISRIIQREETADGLCWVVYHAQEHRPAEGPLAQPIRCATADAWLGPGWYFWMERRFADWWGLSKKCTPPNGYDVYEAWLLLEDDQVLNATFSEEDYSAWRNAIHECRDILLSVGRTFQGKKNAVELHALMTLVQHLLKQRGYKAVVYDDLHQQEADVYFGGSQKKFIYDKRIQMAVFSLDDALLKFARVASNQERPRPEKR